MPNLALCYESDIFNRIIKTAEAQIIFILNFQFGSKKIKS